MAGNPLYNLTWGEYGTSLVSAVQLLRCHGELVDVTLAAGGRTFHAHKVVLCAASPFLLDLLKSTTCKHPIVMLAGVQACDLEALLEFVYRGEVSIEQNQLPSLLQAAHCLNIQGLAPVVNSEQILQESSVKTVLDISKSTIHSQTEPPPLPQEDEAPTKRRKRAKRLLKNVASAPQPTKWPKVYVQIDPSDQQEGSTQTWTEHMNIVSVSSASPSIETLPVQAPILVQSLPTTSNSTTSTKVRGASDQPGTCPVCGAMLRQARNLRRHLLTSCKYRMVGHEIQPSIDQTRGQETQMHHLQTISVQNLDRVNPNSAEHLDSKDGLTPISCSELLPPNSNIISMAPSNL